MSYLSHEDSDSYTVPTLDGGRIDYTRVTKIKDILANPILEFWRIKNVAEYAVDNHDIIGKMLERDDRKTALKNIKGAQWGPRDKAAGLGKAVHKKIERLILGEEVDIRPEEQPYINAFREFVADHPSSVFEASEMTVVNYTVGYAGTLDALMRFDDRVGAVDWKTRQGKKKADVSMYESERLQVAAYVHAEYGLVGDDIKPLPRSLKGGSVVMLCTDGYKLERVSEDDWLGFKAARELFRWKEGL